MIDIAFRARRSKRFGANILSIEKPNDKYGVEVLW